MSVDQFPKYLVLKCLNNEELTTVTKLNISLPFSQVKVTTDLSALAKNESFNQGFSSKTKDVVEYIKAPVRAMDEPVEEMNELTSPEPKRTNISFDIFYYLSDEDKPYDRILMVDNTKFYIQSAKLIEHSDYFRSMFTTDFKEKEHEIIPIKVFNSEKVKLFMDALYKPDIFEITEENLETIIETFVYFQAVTFLVELFNEKNVFENIPTEKLLKIIDNFGFIDLKNIVEQFLIQQINENYENKVPRPLDKTYDVYSDIVCKSLRLSKEYQLNRLHDVTDSHLAYEFNQNLPHSLNNNRYKSILSCYKLVELTNAIETYAISVIDKHTDRIVETYLSDDTKIPMTHLKKAAGPILLNQFNEKEPTEPYQYEKYLKLNQKCDHPELKERICRSLKNMYKVVGQPSKMTLEKFNKLVFKYELEPIKNRQESILLTQFYNNKEDYGYLFNELQEHNLPKLKEAVEDYLLIKFAESEKDDKLFSDLCMFARECNMDKLRDSIEVYFLADFELNHSIENLKYALDCCMEKFEVVLTDYIKSNITVNPILMTGREQILELEDEDQKFILSKIFEGSNEEEDEESDED